MQTNDGELPPPERRPFFGPGAPNFITWFLLAMIVSLLGTNVKGYYSARDACQVTPAPRIDQPPK